MRIKEFTKGSNIQITDNFNSNEFDCNCSECNMTLIDVDHVKKLQKLRDKVKKGIKITSGFRCESWNSKVGGSTNSQHLLGTASDIVVSGMESIKVADLCKTFKGLGIYDSFIHLDSRKLKGKARWDFRKN